MIIGSGTTRDAKWWERQLVMSRVQAVLNRDDGYLLTKRVPCRVPLTDPQMAAVKLISAGKSIREIAEELGCSWRLVRYNIDEANMKVPGDDYPMARLAFWYRGATAEVLERRHIAARAA